MVAFSSSAGMSLMEAHITSQAPKFMMRTPVCGFQAGHCCRDGATTQPLCYPVALCLLPEEFAAPESLRARNSSTLTNSLQTLQRLGATKPPLVERMASEFLRWANGS